MEGGSARLPWGSREPLWPRARREARVRVPRDPRSSLCRRPRLRFESRPRPFLSPVLERGGGLVPPHHTRPGAPTRPLSPGTPAHGELQPRGSGSDRRLRALQLRPPPVSAGLGSASRRGGGRARPGLRGPGRGGLEGVPRTFEGRRVAARAEQPRSGTAGAVRVWRRRFLGWSCPAVPEWALGILTCLLSPQTALSRPDPPSPQQIASETASG